MTRIQEIMREQLSNGDTMRITKLGKEYQLAMLHVDNSPPDIEPHLTRQQADTRWCELVRRDVLEIDD